MVDALTVRGSIYLLAAVVALYALHRLALWMESRGWIYYQKGRGRSASVGSAFLEVQALLEPAKKHQLECQQREVGEDADSGDPPGRKF